MTSTFRRSRRLTGAIILGSTLVAQACYSYMPVSTTSKIGEHIRVELTPDGTTELARYLGPRVNAAEGTLSATGNDGALVVGVDAVELVDGIRQPWAGEGVVSFPRTYVRAVNERVLQKQRTWMAATAGAAALVGLAVVALKSGSAGGNPGGPGGGPPP